MEHEFWRNLTRSMDKRGAPMESLEGKTAFITGAASGIGLAMANAFAGAGMKIALADIEPEPLLEAASGLKNRGADTLTLELDVTERDAMMAAAERTWSHFGGVEVVCNNAGVGGGGALDKTRPEDWDWVLDVNLKGVVNGLLAFLPRMRDAGKGGHIVNTASLAGLIAPPGMGVYVATKFAVVGLSETLKQDLEPYGIGVSVLCPGFVSTKIHHSGRNRQTRFGESRSNPEMQTVVKELVEGGIDPAIVGERVVQAVRGNEFYIFTHPEAREAVEERMKRILDAFPKQ